MEKRPFSEEELSALGAQVRRDIIRMVYDCQSGHPGGSLGCVEYFVALYFDVLNTTARAWTRNGIGQDVFILSNGHISPVFYSVLARAGFFSIAELATFRKLNSRLQGHPSVSKELPGVHISTGSLGQGLSVALGLALNKRLRKEENIVYCLTGDGENQEGQIWEAANFAAHNKIDNLVVAVDLNYKQIDGDTRDIQNTESLAAKWKAFNWEVMEIREGNDLSSVRAGLKAARAQTGKGKPVLVLLHTAMGKGVDYMENDFRWHGKAPSKAEYERAMTQLPATLTDY